MATKLQIYNQALTHLGSRQISAVGDLSKEDIAIGAVYEFTLYSLLKMVEWKFATRQTTLFVDANKSLNSITFSGTTATATTAANHTYAAYDMVLISGATEEVYNGRFPIATVTTNTFTYTLPSTPSASASGTLEYRLAPAINFEYAYRMPDSILYVLDVNEGNTTFFIQNRAIHTDEVGKIYVKYILNQSGLEANFPNDFAQIFALLLASTVAPAIVGDRQLSLQLYDTFQFKLDAMRFLEVSQDLPRLRIDENYPEASWTQR